MIGRFFVKLFAIFFPWLVLLICDNPGGALLALVMQVTLVGWPFAASWAIKSLNETYFDVKKDDEDVEKE